MIMLVRIKNIIIGVPITYLGNHCSEQFEIVGRADANIINENYLFYKKHERDKGGMPIVNNIPIYKRMLIRKK